MQLQCSSCDKKLQALRNCAGTGTPAKIELNNNFYTRCPRAISLESYEARFLVNLYLECRNNNILPASGGLLEQTAFTQELFDFLDDIVGKKRMRDHKAAVAEAKKLKK